MYKRTHSITIRLKRRKFLFAKKKKIDFFISNGKLPVCLSFRFVAFYEINFMPELDSLDGNLLIKMRFANVFFTNFIRLFSLHLDLKRNCLNFLLWFLFHFVFTRNTMNTISFWWFQIIEIYLNFFLYFEVNMFGFKNK